MRLTVLVPTRNNPSGLACLLAYFISHKKLGDQIRFVISDSSDTPVISNQQIARLLPALTTTYLHTAEPEVNQQRLKGLATCLEDMVLMMDDDLLPIGDAYYESLAMTCLRKEEQRVYFGVTVDLTNERGYPDYAQWGHKDDTDPGTHLFVDSCAIIRSQKCQDYCATIGHMLAPAKMIQDTFHKALSQFPHAPSYIIDDAVATQLARASGGKVSLGMKAWHIGNSNRNWGTDWESKRTAVDKVVSALTP